MKLQLKRAPSDVCAPRPARRGLDRPNRAAKTRWNAVWPELPQRNAAPLATEGRRRRSGVVFAVCIILLIIELFVLHVPETAYQNGYILPSPNPASRSPRRGIQTVDLSTEEARAILLLFTLQEPRLLFHPSSRKRAKNEQQPAKNEQQP